MALKKFIARRGRPQSIYSDNGSNFVGADNELRKCIKQLDEERVQNFCAPKEIEWNFQPPNAPHFGGAWERLVQCTKKTLKAILANRIVSKEVLRTALVEAEGILNSRPITHACVQRCRRHWSTDAKSLPADAGESEKQNLKEGDVVLVAEPNQPRGVWPLGRIVSTYPGRDGMVRAVTVRTKTGEYKRPIARLCLLEEALG